MIKILEGLVVSLSDEMKKEGGVEGIAQLVLYSVDIKHFEKGSIIIAKMTNADMMPIMYLAKAVITDEGGMLSHASVNARELGVPCVVGTKYATEKIKDYAKIYINLAGEVYLS